MHEIAAETLSFEQERIWFLNRFYGSVPALYELCAAWLEGPLETPLLQAALRTIGQRHEVLRTIFPEHNGQPYQDVLPEVALSFRALQLPVGTTQSPEQAALQLADEELKAPFAIEQQPPWRVCLIQLSPTQHLLVITLHHIISDGEPTARLLLLELANTYGAAADGGNNATIPLQYRQYARRQRDDRGAALRSQQLVWWQNELSGAPQVMELPTSRPRPALQTFAAQTVEREVSATLTAALRELAAQNECDLETVLLAGLQAVLARYLAPDDVLLGTPLPGRESADLQSLIGYFGNPVVLRARCGGDPSFREFLQQAQTTLAAARAHGQVSFKSVVEALAPVRSLGYPPLVQTLFACFPLPLAPLRCGPLTITPCDLDLPYTAFEQIVTSHERPSGLLWRLKYNRDLLRADAATRLLEHWEVLLRGALAQPDTRLSQLPLLAQPERQRLIVDWNSPPSSDHPACLHELFALQARRTPDAVALTFGPDTLTYRELDKCATQLAGELARLGVTVGTLVGICVERSLEMVVGILAILKSGGAYLPLDPSYPQERLLFMLEDAATTLVLTQERLAARLHAEGRQLLLIDRAASYSSTTSSAPSLPKVQPSDLAYVIYTSGSSGRPKGALIEHRNIVNTALAQRTLFALRPGARVLQLAALGFDACTWELVMALTSGATLCIPAPGPLAGEELGLTLRDLRISIVSLPPSVLSGVPEQTYPELRTVIACGEACPAQLVDRWARGRQFFNAYGPTECAICATMGPCLVDDGPPTIGTPLPNVQVYILDPHGQPVPIGVAGELWIAGAGVGRGYLHREALTRERFLTDPFLHDAARRLYRSGDRARWREDGSIEFLGRLDDQVKLRGFRIELGEIEQALRNQPGVQAAVTVLDTERKNDPRILAYLVAQGAEPLDLTELAAALRRRLPGYMVPAAFITLAALPLTPHGKLDRQALPRPDTTPVTSTHDYTAPRTAIEQALAEIWQQILDVPQIGAHDDFFALGGHSLRAVQVLARVRQRFQVSVSLRQFLAAPTLAALASLITPAAGHGAESIVVPAAMRSSVVPLGLAQERLWLLHQLSPSSYAYNYPAFFRLRGPLDFAALQQSLALLRERHEPLRTTFDEFRGRPVQVIAPPGAWDLPIVELTAPALSGRESPLRQLLDNEAQRPFDLRRGPLFRNQLLRLGEDDQVLLLNLHHTITDGWSMRVLYDELRALYAALSSGQPATLPPLPIQYADHALWHRQQVDSGALDGQLAWWKAQLTGAQMVLELPTDRPRPPLQTFAGATITHSIDRARTDALRQLAASAGATLSMVLLAAFFTLLRRYTGQKDLLVGLPHANRDRLELEGLIGFFVNTLVIRADLSADPSFRELLQSVRTTCLEAYEHAAVPLERLVQALQPERDLRRNPLIQVMFAPQVGAPASLDLPGLHVEPAAHAGGRAPFDLTLYVWESAELSCHFEYNTALFDRETIEQLAQHLGTLLAGVSSQPERPISQVPLLSPATYQRVLYDWNLSQTSYPSESSVASLFEDEVRRTPLAIAARCGERTHTYFELNQRANQLAHRLIQHGVTSGTMVGLFVERSLDMLVGLVAILKAGGAYVPLDADYPIERLRLMLAESQAQHLLCTSEWADKLDFRGTVLPLNEPGEVLFELPDPPSRATATSAAYVMFTSGSTGTPQGVAIPHRAIVRLVRKTDYVELTAQDRILHASSLSFDAATFEIWGALLNGACVVIITKDVLLTPQKFAAMMQRESITTLFLTTALFNQMARECPECFHGVRYLLFGGELCDPERVRDVLVRGRPQQLLHVYGPTENTTFSTWHPVREVPQDGTTVPIGRPIANTTLYILDEHLQPVPPGVAGEIYLGGDGLAVGYLNQPAQTAARFLGDPFTKEPHGRLYKTGDRARFLRSGAVEFLGRNDHQVKIRGFRVELGEIEARIGAHPQVQYVIVVVRKDRIGSKRIVAYVVPQRDAALEVPALRTYLKQKLPEYMLPSSIVLMSALPLNPNGKVDQKALPDAEEARQNPDSAALPTTTLEQELTEIWCDVLGLAQVGVTELFFDIGGHSLLLAQVRAQLRDRLQRDVDMLTLFQYPSIRALAAHLNRSTAEPAKAEQTPPAPTVSAVPAPDPEDRIAIIGFAGRFPGGLDHPEALWKALLEGRECITHLSAEELRVAGADPQLMSSAGFLPSLGRVAGTMLFDAEFFGYSAQDARLMDPQQRWFLECSWEALEHAGYDGQNFPGLVGVFGGASIPRYWLEKLTQQHVLPGTAAQFRTVIGNSRDFLASRVAHKLGLRGPALNVQAACATSLVAIHLACQSLLSRHCDMALAGGVSLASVNGEGYISEEAGVLSRDGHCRPFDAQASGFVPGSGVGLVVLKRLGDALADGDTVHAVIRGSAINNDGALRVGFTAPSVEGQLEVITRAQRAARINPDTITYVEAHGTATPLGDPIEVAALTRAFRQATTRNNYCALGSVKSNLGHLDAAAGVTGLIKTVLALENQCIPGTLHFFRANPALDLENSPFFVPATPHAWLRSEVPRRAGVSAFGLGGNNAHVIVEEAPLPAAASPGRTAQLLVLSARTPTALAAATTRLAAHLLRHPATPLADVAHTLQHGRRALPYRRALCATGSLDAAAALTVVDRERMVSGTAADSPPELVFMFPGGGTQQLGMGQQLYTQEPVYRQAVDSCAALFAAELHYDLRKLLQPAPAERATVATQLARPSANMAAIFTTEYALAQLLLSFGLKPAAVIGHSLGEYAAVCIAGVLSLADAVALVSLRGRLSDDLPPSMMLSVALSEAALRPRLGASLSIAAVNSTSYCVVSGPTEAVTALAAQLEHEQIETRPIPIAMAAHSILVEPLAPLLTARAATMQRHAPRIPIVSNLTGTWLTAEEVCDAGYWARHFRQTVRFADGLTTLLSGTPRCLVEVGPGKTLSSLLRLHPRLQPGQVVTATLGPVSEKRSESEALLLALGQLWCAGIPIHWAALQEGERRRRVPLPTYPFERREFMLESPAPVSLGNPRPSPVVPEPPPAYRAPSPALTTTLAALWQELLGVSAVSPSDDFFALGGSSLLAIQLRVRVKELLGVTIPVHTLVAHPTFAALVSEIEQLTTSPTRPTLVPPPAPSRELPPPIPSHESPPALAMTPPPAVAKRSLLVCLQPGKPGHVPLFLFQSVGGTVYAYRELAARLGAAQPVYAFRASGMEPGEPLHSDFSAMVTTYLEELLQVQPGPYFLLGGYSSGGAIAYEMAAQLIQRGYQVPFVFLADSGPAEQYERMGIKTIADLLRVGKAFEKTAPRQWASLRTALSDTSPLHAVIIGTYHALATYKPKRSSAGIVYFRASERDEVLDPHPEAWWMEHADGPFVVYNAPGHHLTMMDTPHVKYLARVIRHHLRSWQPKALLSRHRG